ncbi:MAG: silent information regulator protein Sir2 [Bacteroidales bacterium]|nr:silent information regulator protein Sir2 [Bacteroidales bacterium]
MVGNLTNSSIAQNQNWEKAVQKYGQLEQLSRGLIAIPTDKGGIYVGWRLLARDPDGIAFNLYRNDGNGSVTKLNDHPIKNSTDYLDENAPTGEKLSYTVKPIIQGKEGDACESYEITSQDKHSDSYLSIKLNGNDDFQKVGIADLDGKGGYDFVIKQPDTNIDPWYKYWRPSGGTYTLEAYRHDGKSLWTYDLGWSIERGIWYSPYVVYDLNGDGQAEVAVKTGEGDPRDEEGRVKSGPEYLTILDGMTGQPIDQADWISRQPFYDINPPDPASPLTRGYNHSSRNQLGIAYLDGEHPHLIEERGTYDLIIVRAYRLIEGSLKLVWEWDNRDAPDYYWGQGAHWLHSADVDQDGRDEVILGSAVLDNDGTELWSTGLGHPDACYVGDLDPDRPGLEIYYVIETGQSDGNGMCMVDAKTGQIIWGIDAPTNHVHGKGLCSDIDRVHPGRECYGAESGHGPIDFAIMHNSKGEIIDRDLMGNSPLCVHWDEDNQRELLIGGEIFDYRGEATYTKIEGNVIAIADIFGDWREEIITSVEGEIRIYTSTIPANDRRNCLMQDPIYRIEVAHASMGYESVPTTTYPLPWK